MAERIIEKSVAEIAGESYSDYAKYVITDRALPDVRDGLKPVQRRILYSMYELGLNPEKQFRKCARIVGDVLGKYHPHGDSSVYGALVLMAQSFSKRYPLVQGQGNFGTLDDGPAAMRYTEAKMSSYAMDMLRDLSKNVNDWQENFDESEKEPEVLPALLPNLLVNGSSGIAVGFSTKIPSHNLTEVIDGIIAYIDNKNISAKGLMKYIKGPDFPTGGIVSPDKLLRCYQRGKGKIAIRGRASIEELPGDKRQLVITEIPYEVKLSTLLDKMIRYIAKRKEEDVVDIRDETGQNGMRIIIEMDKGGNAEKLLKDLYENTYLQSNYSYKMVAVVDGKPKLLPLKALIEEYVKHQKEVITRRSRYDLNKAKARYHIVKGLMTAIDVIDEIIATIKSSNSPSDAKKNLMNKFKFTKTQAEAILDIKLQRLTALQITSLRSEKADLEKAIVKLEAILSSEANLLAQLKKELKVMRNSYKEQDKRKTVIKKFDKIEVQTKVEEFTLQVSKSGKLKRLSKYYYGDKGVTLRTDSTQNIWLFGEEGNFMSFTGMTVPKRIKMKVIKMVNQSDYGANDSVVIMTSDGQIKKSAFLEYIDLRNDSRAISLDDNAKVTGVYFESEDNEVVIFTRNGYAIRFDDKDVRQIGRVTKGVRAIRLEDGDEVVGFVTYPSGTEEGKINIYVDDGKKIGEKLSNIRLQNRDGKGYQLIKKAKIECVEKAEG